MEENKGDYSLNDIVNLVRSFLAFLRKKWWLLLLAGLIGAGLGAMFYFRQKSKYEAVATFILEEKSSGGGGLAGLASQFGINVGSLGGGGSLFAGDNILSILASKKVIQEVLLSRVEGMKPDNKTLADHYLEFMGIKESWEKKPWLKGISFNDTKRPLSPVQDSVLNVIYESIVKSNLETERISKQGSIIKVKVTASDALFARVMTDRLVDEASKLYLDIRIGTSQDNIRQLQSRSDSLLILLNRKSFTAAASQPLDVNPALRTEAVAGEIATRDKAVLATIYTEVTKNLEASKMALSQQMPVIQVLDRPSYLLVDKKKGMLFWMVAFIAGVGAIAVGCAFLYFLRTAKMR